MHAEPRPVRATLLIHQEGALALVALVGLSLTGGGVLGGLAPRPTLAASLAMGVATAAACLAVLWPLRRFGPLARLEQWQREVVSGWTVTDAVAVALASGLAEEALLRALLQPIIGLVPAAAIFAVLHLVPDRRLWVWPVFALAVGLLFGVVFDGWGYPAVAAAHVLVNLAALVRLRRKAGE